ncbi:MAG: PAS domain S-box protein, partial [Lentisphaerae bacterium]|nr:PAS domain S-box protein [Lentisphaerota bacterium]
MNFSINESEEDEIKYFYLKLFIFFLLLCLFIGTPSLSTASQEEKENQRILVLNSYHPGYKWSDDIMLGIRDVIGKQNGVELIIEYLDTNRHFKTPYLQKFEELFRHKYKDTNIDLVITSDDNALDFVLGIRKELFPGIPLVFCGIDHINPERLAGQESVYGIEEADSTASTIDLILSIHPGIKSLTFIADETSTGKLMIDRTRKLERTFQKNIHFNYIIGVSVEELQLTLKDIPGNTVIFYLSFIRDKNGKVFSIEESMKLIAKNANVPVYCSWGFQSTTGMLGGNILSGYKQGEISAEVARKLLINDSVESIPAIQPAPLVYKFDYQALDQFNIDESRIPENSIIYNKPFSFFKEYKTLIVITLFIGLCLVLFIMLLFLNIKRRKKAEAELQKAHDHLDQKVNIRTAELTKSNELLNKEIKERKHATDALSAKEIFLNHIIDQSPHATWISDAEGTLQRANPALKKFVNLTDEQLVGKYNVLNDKIAKRQGLQPLFQTVFKEGKTITFSLEWDGNDMPNMDLKGSNSVCVEGTMFPIHNSEGKLTNVVLNWIDITKRKLAEEALQESEKKYRSMMEAMDDATYICSSDFHIEYMNPAMIKRIGHDATGEPCHKVMHGLDKKCPWCIHERVMSGERIKYEQVSPLDDKTYHISNSPIFHTDGSVSKLTAFHDVTEIKKLEFQLQQTQKIEAIGTLAGGIAHDFNNMLGVITGNISYVLSSLNKEDELYQILSDVQESSKQAQNLTHQLLTFSKGGAPVKKVADINKLIKESAIFSTRGAKANCSFELQDNLWLSEVDEGQINQVIGNLVINANQAMPNGGT